VVQEESSLHFDNLRSRAEPRSTSERREALASRLVQPLFAIRKTNESHRSNKDLSLSLSIPDVQLANQKKKDIHGTQTSHLQGWNCSGSTWCEGSKWTAPKMGRTFQPAGITYPTHHESIIGNQSVRVIVCFRVQSFRHHMAPCVLFN
jgi:hypothetical protein